MGRSVKDRRLFWRSSYAAICLRGGHHQRIHRHLIDIPLLHRRSRPPRSWLWFTWSCPWVHSFWHFDSLVESPHDAESRSQDCHEKKTCSSNYTTKLSLGKSAAAYRCCRCCWCFWDCTFIGWRCSSNRRLFGNNKCCCWRTLNGFWGNCCGNSIQVRIWIRGCCYLGHGECSRNGVVAGAVGASKPILTASIIQRRWTKVVARTTSFSIRHSSGQSAPSQPTNVIRRAASS